MTTSGFSDGFDDQLEHRPVATRERALAGCTLGGRHPLIWVQIPVPPPSLGSALLFESTVGQVGLKAGPRFGVPWMSAGSKHYFA